MDSTGGISVSLSLILLGILGMLLLALAVIAFFFLYQRRLFAQQDKIRELETAYQKDLLKASISAQEVERRRVATDLHDGVGSLLSAIRLYVLQLSPKLSETAYGELLQETKTVVDTAIDQTRKIAHNLLPTTLERFGAIHAIGDLCKRIQQMSGLEIQVVADDPPRLTQEQDLALYRITQELINNTLKHAGASRVDIEFQSSPTEFHMIYADNGKGFAYASNGHRQQAGLGMKSISSRAQLINAETRIESAPGAGFRFELVVGLGEGAET